MVRIRKVRVVALALPIAFAAVAGTALADPVLVEAMGLDVWHIGQLERDLRESQRRDGKLERELQCVIDRATTHNYMLDDLVAGRQSLSETARRKWEMNRDRAVLLDHLERDRLGPTPEAKMAHDLIEFACGRDAPAGLRQSLAAQYEAAYGVALPDPK